jgi:hypothetical protein
MAVFPQFAFHVAWVKRGLVPAAHQEKHLSGQLFGRHGQEHFNVRYGFRQLHHSSPVCMIKDIITYWAPVQTQLRTGS